MCAGYMTSVPHTYATKEEKASFFFVIVRVWTCRRSSLRKYGFLFPVAGLLSFLPQDVREKNGHFLPLGYASIRDLLNFFLFTPLCSMVIHFLPSDGVIEIPVHSLQGPSDKIVPSLSPSLPFPTTDYNFLESQFFFLLFRWKS